MKIICVVCAMGLACVICRQQSGLIKQRQLLLHLLHLQQGSGQSKFSEGVVVLCA